MEYEREYNRFLKIGVKIDIVIEFYWYNVRNCILIVLWLVFCKYFVYDFIRMVFLLFVDKVGLEKCFVERCRVIWVF